MPYFLRQLKNRRDELLDYKVWAVRPRFCANKCQGKVECAISVLIRRDRLVYPTLEHL
jgi:hypothetical protein